VGNACGANPYPIVVPCHRVVAANHGLGGFARNRGGFLLEVKRWLLDHERAR
jgi:methylated-DNA-[protein]-cysteine S-methyltransferase